MKTVLFAISMALFAGIASAQSTQNSKMVNKGIATHKTTVHNKRKSKGTKTASNKTLNQRKEYQWKNGQEATPTGHEATVINGGYAAIKKDTATKKPSHKQDH